MSFLRICYPTMARKIVIARGVYKGFQYAGKKAQPVLRVIGQVGFTIAGVVGAGICVVAEPCGVIAATAIAAGGGALAYISENAGTSGWSWWKFGLNAAPFAGLPRVLKWLRLVR